jgi:hypothetical protein
MYDFLIPSAPATDTVPAELGAAVPVPMEHLAARICELAGHLTAATCQFLLLVADFDAREGWAAWEMASCTAWLSWKCQIARLALDGIEVGSLEIVADEDTAQSKAALSADPAITYAAQLTPAAG